LWGTGATFVDINNDGMLDIYACAYDMPNRLYINLGIDGQGRSRFEEAAARYGLAYSGASMTMAFADIDNDGDLDGYLATTAKMPPAGTKFEVEFQGEKPVIPKDLEEYWQFIYLPGDAEAGLKPRAQKVEAGQRDHLFRNEDGHFTDITDESGIAGPYFTLSATWWDYNHDGLPDVYVSNDYYGPDKLYQNNGDGTFRDVLLSAVPNTPWFSMGSDQGDLNNDGYVDFFACDMSATTHYRDKVMMGNMSDTGWFLDFAEPRQYMRNALYLNTGTRRMMEVAYQAGLSSTDWTWNPRLADLDNDGRLDVFTTNGIIRDLMNSDLTNEANQRFAGGSPEWAKFWAELPMHPEKNMAFRNLGNMKFENVGAQWGLDRLGVSFGAATADFDNDGDLDLIVNNADAKVSIYENQDTTGNRVRIRLEGTRSNRFGVGATVQLVAAGMRQTQYVTLARGWLSACEPVLHFGLGEAEKIDELVIHWPSGHVQRFSELAGNSTHTITEPSRPVERADERGPAKTGPDRVRPSYRQAVTYQTVSHQENRYDDFERQPLLPNRQSQFGPAMSLGDIDGDGDLDGFLGGAAGYPGQVFVNDGKGWTPRPCDALQADASHEDVAAVWFDFDQDGDLDLYVVSGSDERSEGDDFYQDRLYLNDGQGELSRAVGVLPELRDNGSAVAAADFDQDGDVDLFVGGRARPGEYPLAAPSRLLVNEGGRLDERTPGAFSALGIVNAAMWSDVDGDGRLDLMVATEWGPVRLLRYEDETFVDRTREAGLADRLGWWNAIAESDLDRDGDIDYVVTNFGLNTKYKASPEKPELLYYGDMDGSGQADLVEAKFEGERCLPRRGYSCSSTAMPFLKTKVGTFHNFASSSLNDLYGEQLLEKCQRFECNTLTSGVLWNDGQGRFEFRALPFPAQAAPSFGVAAEDVDGDGHGDIVMAQNFYGPQRETGRMNGGVGLLLKGDGKGEFTAVWPNQSGVFVPGDARQVVMANVHGDESLEIVVAVNNGALQVFERVKAE
jgi:hypothetical protein